MLDPRILSIRRDDVVRAVQRRGVHVDVDAAIVLHERLTAAQTVQQQTSRLRNDHQAAGKAALSQADREAHVAEGRRLKEAVARLDAEVAAAQAALTEAMLAIPNLVHPEVPDGGENDFRVLRTWGTPPRFDFAAKDHL